MARCAACHGPKRFTSIARWRWPVRCSIAGRGRSSPRAALLTRMSRPPDSRARSSSAVSSSGLPLSTRSASDSTPRVRHSDTVSSAASLERAYVSKTCAPSCARRNAIARPIPRDPPRTSARRVFNDSYMGPVWRGSRVDGHVTPLSLRGSRTHFWSNTRRYHRLGVTSRRQNDRSGQPFGLLLDKPH